MRCKALLRHAFFWSLGLFVGLSPVAFAEAVSPQEQIQVNASRATSSLLLLRGEGFQKVHLQRLEADLAALAARAPFEGLAAPGPRGRWRVGVLTGSAAEAVLGCNGSASSGPPSGSAPLSRTQYTSSRAAQIQAT